ncbi:unnamed protein product [Cylindrotheca closterium]|uniref:WWE domain-containing protein n=1 Tax=Cylindrotheca closterium TaxID=2856 RepID=A0AAD2CGF9_9STRA|nr:unnamed protein product [Cylindrotheca closterium]
MIQSNAETETRTGDRAFDFPIDLVELSKQHVGFLQTLHQLGVTIRRPSPKSLQRYRDLWLPLIYANRRETLVPPADCAWLWHCHRLAPFRYTSYLRREFGEDCQMLEANPPFCFQWNNDEVYGGSLNVTDDDMNLAAERTRSLWNQQYPGERFHLQMDESDSRTILSIAEEKIDDRDLSLNGFDLLGSTDRQATFLWQVSGPRFANDDFLKEGALQYYKFLKLRKKAEKSNIVLVPTYQIDLMWHTHILSSLTGYFVDCKAIIGTTLNHDDSLNDRTDDGPLDRAFKDTKALWKKNYEEDYFVKGGMYRGEPPKEYYNISWCSRVSNEEAQIPLGPFLHLIDLQGASSTNPTGGAYDLDIVWAWKETASQMSKHPASSVAGDPSECWIKYDNSSNTMLEAAFQNQGGEGTCDLGNGYVVDFLENKQTKQSTGYVREVQRTVNVKSALESRKVWCWKETQGQMGKHSPSSIVGDPSECWIKYDNSSNTMLETAFRNQGGEGTCDLGNGYVVDFLENKQTKTATGYVREVQRMANVKCAMDDPKVWCWQETQGHMGKHSASAIYGNPSDCWIKYDDKANSILESAYQANGSNGEISPSDGYMVNFTTMKQTKIATGFVRTVRRVDANDQAANATSTTYWTSIYGSAPDGSPAFISMSPKSTSRGINANPFRQNYIFGRNGNRTGYFHITTKEAYEILAKRIMARIKAKNSDIAMATCCGLFTAPKKMEDDLEKLVTAESIIKARARAVNPTGKEGLPAKYTNNRQVSNKHYSDAGIWYFPTEYYACGGMCGGGAARGAGGCGASGCGAAACGAAACGGGGGENPILNLSSQAVEEEEGEEDVAAAAAARCVS